MFFVEELLTFTMKLLKKLIILIALVIVYVFSNAVSIYIYSFKDEARIADVAIVLGASTYNGHASPVYQERINHAVVLYNKHLVKKIITTGGYGKGNPVSDAYNAKLYAISQGVPEDDILTEDQSTVTLENLIVSDPLHMKRAMLQAKDAGITAYTSPTQSSRYRTRDTKFQFLKREVINYIGYKWYRLFKPLIKV